jgi:hypothetical protein
MVCWSIEWGGVYWPQSPANDWGALLLALLALLALLVLLALLALRVSVLTHSSHGRVLGGISHGVPQIGRHCCLRVNKPTNKPANKQTTPMARVACSTWLQR